MMFLYWTSFRLDAPVPFAEGHAFGEVGPYLRITGVAKGELDPAAAQNKGIVDLDKAPRNARGMVEYEVDVFFLRPADPARPMASCSTRCSTAATSSSDIGCMTSSAAEPWR